MGRQENKHGQPTRSWPSSNRRFHRSGASPWGLAIAWVAALSLAGCAHHQKKPVQASFHDLCLQPAVSKPACTTEVVHLSDGEETSPVCGLAVDTYPERPLRAFLGIPFAQPPCGEKRWQPPQPVTAWKETLPATRFGPRCPQGFPKAFQTEQSEGCLHINVWTPAESEDELQPVMVWIYGGSFIMGASSSPLYDPTYLAAHGDVVVVSFNYRLGALGFLAGVPGSDGEPLQGNFGLLDQVAALEWVAANIEHFGGDPNRVTIFGESAGAASVSLLLTAMPSAEDLFQAAILESPYYGVAYRNVAEARAAGEILAKGLHCPKGDFSCLQHSPFEEVVKAQARLAEELPAVVQGFPGIMAWNPTVDGTVVTRQPDTRSIDKPTLMGTNHDEGAIFVYGLLDGLKAEGLSPGEYRLALDWLYGREEARRIESHEPYRPRENSAPVLEKVLTDSLFTCPARRVASQVAPEVRDRLFTYQFDQVSNFNIWSSLKQCQDLVCHGDDIPYVFHSARPAGHHFTPEEARLSEAMVRYWSSFATHHDPNPPTSEAPEWPAFPEYLLLEMVGKGEEAQIPAPVSDPFQEMCAFWEEVGVTAGDPFSKGLDLTPR